jgi:hypothetical protein
MTLQLIKTRMIAGVWEGVLSGVDGAPPAIGATHLGEPIEGVTVERDLTDAHWVVPVPAHLLSDGVQTFLITDTTTGETLNSFSLLSGNALAGDIRAEITLLREELDMLKSAFRRHCVETT